MAEGTALQVLAGDATWSVTHGDCIELLRSLPDCSVDAVVCDPPYELNFMGRTWDRSGIAFDPETWRAVFRVMKPGAHLLAFGGTRTFHRIAVAIEDAGFTIRDSLAWLHGQGFPKNLDASKAIDAKLGAERAIPVPSTAMAVGSEVGAISANRRCSGCGKPHQSADPCRCPRDSGPVTKEAEGWSGFGTAVKPSFEPIILARKPLIGTLAENLLEHGTGALNIDGTRVGFANDGDKAAAAAAAQRACQDQNAGRTGYGDFNNGPASLAPYLDGLDKGRWPPNVLLSHADGCRRRAPVVVPAHPTWDTPNRATEPSAFTGDEVSRVRHANGRDGEASADKRYTTDGATAFAMLPGERRDETETVEQWSCVEGCPVAELSAQSGSSPSGGVTHQPTRSGYNGGYTNGTHVQRAPDDGSAARYFPQFQDDEPPFHYLPKPARGEVEAGLDHFRQRSGGEATDREDGQVSLESPRSGSGRRGGIRNVHPTKKSVDLMRWLVRLVTPPGGVVLDPFTGSGATGVAALCESKRFVGAELNDTDAEPFASIARARLHHAEGRSFVPRESLRAAEPPKQRALFEVGT